MRKIIVTIALLASFVGTAQDSFIVSVFKNVDFALGPRVFTNSTIADIEAGDFSDITGLIAKDAKIDWAPEVTAFFRNKQSFVSAYYWQERKASFDEGYSFFTIDDARLGISAGTKLSRVVPLYAFVGYYAEFPLQYFYGDQDRDYARNLHDDIYEYYLNQGFEAGLAIRLGLISKNKSGVLLKTSVNKEGTISVGASVIF